MVDDVSVAQQVRDADLLKHEDEQLESLTSDLKEQLASKRLCTEYSGVKLHCSTIYCTTALALEEFICLLCRSYYCVEIDLMISLSFYCFPDARMYTRVESRGVLIVNVQLLLKH